MNLRGQRGTAVLSDTNASGVLTRAADVPRVRGSALHGREKLGMRGPKRMLKTSMVEMFVKREDSTGEVARLPCRCFVLGMLRPPDILACRSLRGQLDSLPLPCVCGARY